MPDALQPLAHHHQVGDVTTEWSSIETLTRPDGSLAQSFAVSRDGTQIRSRFQATSITRTVTLANGQTVRIDTDSGLQSVYLGDDRVPQFQSRWTAKGPKVVRARQHLAFLLDRNAIDDTPARQPEQMLTGPGGGGGDFGMGAIARALASLFFIQQAAPTSQGLGTDDVPFLALRAWVAGADTGMVPYRADAIAQERIRKFCTLLPDAQGWTDEAALALAARKPILSATGYGKALHQLVKAQFESRKALQPAIYADSYAEYSIDASGGEIRYGTSGSSRLDLIQFVPVERPRVICIIDVKTGGATVQSRQRDAYMRRMLRIYPEAVVLMMQVKPSVYPF